VFLVTAEPTLLVLDLVGTFVFALDGALVALRVARLDIVGAITLGMVTAIGGGVARDVLLARVSIVLQKEIYASAAFAGAALCVIGERLGWPQIWAMWLPIVACFGLRFVSLHLHWNLPRFGRERPGD
jgi:uncharacterized membrane protein YeiH